MLFQLAQNGNVTIDLAADVEAFVRAQVQAGVCANAGELINDVLRSLRDQQRRPFEVTPELEAWLLHSADQPTSPLLSKDFDEIRERVLSRQRKS